MQDNPSEPIIEAAGTLAGTTPTDVGQFDYRLVTTFSYAFGNSQIGLGWRHYPSIKDDDAARDPNTRILPVASYNIFNLFGRYQINDRMEFRGGIDNLLDEEPPVVGAGPRVRGVGVNTRQQPRRHERELLRRARPTFLYRPADELLIA